MATIVSTGFENGLTPGGVGISVLNTPANISLSSAWSSNGTKSMMITGNASVSIYAAATISQQVISGIVAFKLASTTPSGAIALVRGQQPAHTFNINLNPNGKLQSAIGGTTGTSGTTVLSAATAYWLCFRYNASGTTHSIDWTLRNAAGTTIETGTQQTLGGQTAAALTSIQFGQNGSVSLSGNWDDITVTDQSGDHPLTAREGNDGTFTPITNFPRSWLDDSSRIGGGALFGLMTMNTGSGDNGQAALSQGVTKANRKNYVFSSFYSNCQTAGTMLFEHSVQTGTLLGHQGWPMIHPFGFGSSTVNWPAGGMSDFASGSMDIYLDLWVSVLNTQLGATPFLIRPFREMTNNVTIYGPNGSSVGGLNETPTNFIAGWRHVYTYITSRVPMARFVWCPDSVQSVATSISFYPGDAYVDWVGVDGYKTSGNSYSLANLQTWYTAYKSGGSAGNTKPLMVCETSVQAADPNRITDFQAYTAEFIAMPEFKVVNFWDSASAGPYYVSDSPAGFLAAFQSVVGSAPFVGQQRNFYHPVQVPMGVIV